MSQSRRFGSLALVALGLCTQLASAKPGDGGPTYSGRKAQEKRRDVARTKAEEVPGCLKIAHQGLAPNDYFDQIVVFPAGPFKGCQADTTHERTVKPLRPRDAIQILGQRSPLDDADVRRIKSDGMRTFANFRHAGGTGFWVATINPNHVESVIFQTEHFQQLSDGKIPAAHSQIRLIMKGGRDRGGHQQCVQLYSQMRDRLGSKGPCVMNVIYSVEAMNTRDAAEDFDLIKGMQKNFMLSYKLIHMRDKALYMVNEAKHKVEQLKINLSAEEVVSVVNGFLDQASDPEHVVIYHTLQASCTSELYRVLDKTIVRKRPLGKNALNRLMFGKSLPIFPGTYLGGRGLIEAEIQELGEEFGTSKESLSQIP